MVYEKLQKPTFVKLQNARPEGIIPSFILTSCKSQSFKFHPLTSVLSLKSCVWLEYIFEKAFSLDLKIARDGKSNISLGNLSQ